MKACKYCWRPADLFVPADITVIVDGVPHNTGCPVIDGNFQDWEEGRLWGWDNSTMLKRRDQPVGKSQAYYYGVRAGQSEMEALVQAAAEDNYYGVHEREY